MHTEQKALVLPRLAPRHFTPDCLSPPAHNSLVDPFAQQHFNFQESQTSSTCRRSLSPQILLSCVSGASADSLLTFQSAGPHPTASIWSFLLFISLSSLDSSCPIPLLPAQKLSVESEKSRSPTLTVFCAHVFDRIFWQLDTCVVELVHLFLPKQTSDPPLTRYMTL